MNHYHVTFRLENELHNVSVKHAAEGMLLKTVAEELGYKLRSNCGGNGTCKKCRLIADGTEVLACRTKVETDCNITIPLTSVQSDKDAVVVSAHTFGVAAKHGHRIGVAVDIGTTTLAAELVTTEVKTYSTSRANPQRCFGDDVLSRIQKVMEEPETLVMMQQLVVSAVNEMIAALAEQAGIAVQDIAVVTVAGNTVMQLLLHGTDPSPLGMVPFRSPVSEFPSRFANEIGLKIAENGILETMPIFGGFVGGDIVAGVLTLAAMQENSAIPEPALFIDIGTNGELVLFHDGKLYTTATAAGPAFEGARIECGTLAVPGAIDHVYIENGERKISTIRNEKAIGICGSGLIDAVAVLLQQGIIKKNGQLDVDGTKTRSLALTSEVYLSQKDIRQLQLASGAIRAGMMLLLEMAGIRTEDLAAFYVAGGFGQFIDRASAQRIGLIPPELPPERIHTCGNTSLAGAKMLLLEPEYTATAKQYIAKSQNVELAALPRFSTVFAESMMFG
jgi:uncharacterized 2Fe-2S/4Fe-4S cluster protein (DUF4445 family)